MKEHQENTEFNASLRTRIVWKSHQQQHTLIEPLTSVRGLLIQFGVMRNLFIYKKCSRYEN